MYLLPWVATAVSTSGKVRWALRVWSFWPGLAELEIKPQDVMPAAEWALQALRLEGTGRVERNHLEKRWKNGRDPLWGQSQTRQRRSTHRIWQFSNSSKHFHSIFVQTNFSWFTTGTSHPPQHVRWRLASAGVRKVRSWVSIGSAGTAAVFAVWHGIPWKAASP